MKQDLTPLKAVFAPTGKLRASINLGNPNETSIFDFAQKIIGMAKSHSKIVYRALPQDDPKTRCPDITKAKQFLNWHPNTELVKGLEYTVQEMKNRLNAFMN